MPLTINLDALRENTVGYLSRNKKRLAIGAGVVGAGIAGSKPAGRVAGNRSVKKDDPYYDMNRRAGAAVFRARRQYYDEGLDEEGIEETGSRTFGRGMGRLQRDKFGKAIGSAVNRLTSAKATAKSAAQSATSPGTVVPVAVGAGGTGVAAARYSGARRDAQYNKRQSGARAGYEGAYRQAYGRRRREEEVQEADAEFTEFLGRFARSAGKNFARGVKAQADGKQMGRNFGDGLASSPGIERMRKTVRNAGFAVGGGVAAGGVAAGAGSAAGARRRREDQQEARNDDEDRRTVGDAVDAKADWRGAAVARNAVASVPRLGKVGARVMRLRNAQESQIESKHNKRGRRPVPMRVRRDYIDSSQMNRVSRYLNE